MTKKATYNGQNKTTRTPKFERASFVGYVNYTLTEEDREDFVGWVESDGLFDETLLEALSVGYQFSIKQDTSNDAIICSVSRWDETCEDAGIIYTARSSEYTRALEKCVYVLSRKLNWSLSNGLVKGHRGDAF
jgi:hypothetical protein